MIDLMFPELIAYVAGSIAVVAPVVKNLGEIAKGGRQVLDLADHVIGRFRKKGSPAQSEAALRQALAEAAALPQAEFDKQAEQIVARELADKPVEYQQAITEYIKLMPARIRSTFSRPEDPTGTTAPPTWAVTRAEDLVPFLPPRPPMFREGDRPPEAGRWVLTQRLGIGGFGEVWQARSESLRNTFAAFKFCLDPDSQRLIFENERDNIEMVKNELTDHPNIVKLIDAHFECATPWLQYEYIPGGDLGQLVASWPSDLETRARLAVQCIATLAETLGHCHNDLPRRVIHRDMKPANVLVGRNGTLKITDFGISDTQARQALVEARLLTVTGGASMSTPSMIRWANTHTYASPQQRRGESPHTSDDVHALGVMLYQMLLGNLNLELGVDMWQDLEEQHLCTELREVLSRSVATRVERRYQNASEMAEALARLPQKLVVGPVVVSAVDQEKLLYEEFDRRAADAQAKNESARQQVERREYREAVVTLESIFHPTLRDADLYARATQHRDGKRFVNALGMELALLPAGTFWMGGGDGKCGNRKVTIDYDFYLGVYPVTQEEWQKVMGNNPSYFRKIGHGADKLNGVSEADLKRFPVEGVRWDNCQVFLKKLNESVKETGWIYRLPREIEWEYGARAAANTQALCSFSYYHQEPTNALLPQKANFDEAGIGHTCKVGSYQPNQAGLFDMHGLVWEMCDDGHAGSDRLFRGGAWNCTAEHCSATRRITCSQLYTFSHFGLRIARVPSGK